MLTESLILSGSPLEIIPSSELNMNLAFHISGSEIELKYRASSKTSVKSSRKYFVHLNWIRLATTPSCLDSSIGRAAV